MTNNGDVFCPVCGKAQPVEEDNRGRPRLRCWAGCRTRVSKLCDQVDVLVTRFAGDPSQGATTVLPPALHKLKQLADEARGIAHE